MNYLKNDIILICNCCSTSHQILRRPKCFRRSFPNSSNSKTTTSEKTPKIRLSSDSTRDISWTFCRTDPCATFWPPCSSSNTSSVGAGSTSGRLPNGNPMFSYVRWSKTSSSTKDYTFCPGSCFTIHLTKNHGKIKN